MGGVGRKGRDFAGLLVENLHALAIDNRRAACVLRVRLVLRSVLGRHVIPVCGGGYHCDDAAEAVLQLGVTEDLVGDCQRERAAGGATDGIEFLWIAAEGGGVGVGLR